MKRLALAVARVWIEPGVVIDDAEVHVADGVISWVGPASSAPEADEHIESTGFCMPAVADRHVHIELADPWSVLRRGVTAVRDLAWPADRIFPLADLSESPAFEGPLIRAAGPMLTAPGGYPMSAEWAPAGTGLEVPGPHAAAEAVAALADRGAAAIKVSLNAEAGPTPDDPTLLAIVDAAALAELPVTAHAQGVGQVARALGAGIGEFAHTPWEPLSDDLVEAVARSMRIVSTLDITSFGRDTPELRIALDNLGRFLGAGGEVVYGTDLGNGSAPPGIHRREVLLLREAGLDPDGVLQAMVRAPLIPGAPADLLVLGADPLEDLRAFDDIRLVVRGGAPVT